jgi:hypothetical protein
MTGRWRWGDRGERLWAVFCDSGGVGSLHVERLGGSGRSAGKLAPSTKRRSAAPTALVLFLLRIPALTHWANISRASGAGALLWTIRIATDALR